jgi:hypothetical protein
LENILSKHPILGIFSSFGGCLLPLIDFLSPILQLIGMIVGVFIGIFTLLIKIKEWREHD